MSWVSREQTCMGMPMMWSVTTPVSEAMSCIYSPEWRPPREAYARVRMVWKLSAVNLLYSEVETL